MSGFPTVNFSDSDQGLFTPAEIRRLMRIEYERAVRYDYPIICMLIEVDRLETLHDLYGYESKEEILNAVIGLLRSMTRSSDFLGCMHDDRLMAMFPHTPGVASAELARRLLGGTRRLRFDSDGRTLRATLSVGVASSDPDRRTDYEEFLGRAEEALEEAVAEGGDRFVVRHERPRTDLDELRAELESARLALVEARRDVERPPAPPPPAATAPGPPVLPPGTALPVADLPDTPLGAKLRQLFERVGASGEDVLQLQREIVELTLANLEAARAEAVERQLRERDAQIELLERRVRKLASMLDMTEAELSRLAGMKDVDPGIASIYRSIQGLTGQERDFQVKKALMEEIFKANLALKRERERRRA